MIRAILVCYGLLLIVMSVIDYRKKEVSNWFTIVPIVPIIFLTGNVLYSLLGIFVMFIIGMFLWKRKTWGGGDVKVLTTIGAVLGILLIPKYLIFFAVVSIFYIGIGLLITRKKVFKPAGIPIMTIAYLITMMMEIL